MRIWDGVLLGIEEHRKWQLRRRPRNMTHVLKERPFLCSNNDPRNLTLSILTYERRAVRCSDDLLLTYLAVVSCYVQWTTPDTRRATTAFKAHLPVGHCLPTQQSKKPSPMLLDMVCALNRH